MPCSKALQQQFIVIVFLCSDLSVSGDWCWWPFGHKPSLLSFPFKLARPPAVQIIQAARLCLSHGVFLCQLPALAPFILILDALLTGAGFKRDCRRQLVQAGYTYSLRFLGWGLFFFLPSLTFNVYPCFLHPHRLHSGVCWHDCACSCVALTYSGFVVFETVSHLK